MWTEVSLPQWTCAPLSPSPHTCCPPLCGLYWFDLPCSQPEPWFMLFWVALIQRTQTQLSHALAPLSICPSVWVCPVSSAKSTRCPGWPAMSSLSDDYIGIWHLTTHSFFGAMNIWLQPQDVRHKIHSIYMYRVRFQIKCRKVPVAKHDSYGVISSSNINSLSQPPKNSELTLACMPTCQGRFIRLNHERAIGNWGRVFFSPTALIHSHFVTWHKDIRAKFLRHARKPDQNRGKKKMPPREDGQPSASISWPR